MLKIFDHPVNLLNALFFIYNFTIL